MKKNSVNINLTSGFVFAVVGVVGVSYFFYRGKKATASIAESLNPTHRNNIVNKSAQNIFGKERLQNGFDKVFAVVDIVNPFNKSDAYAREVLGLEKKINKLEFLP